MIAVPKPPRGLRLHDIITHTMGGMIIIIMELIIVIKCSFATWPFWRIAFFELDFDLLS